MEAVFIYLLKVSLATSVFYLTYYFLFKAKKQFVFNRFYLLLVLPVAHIIPLITFPTKADLSLATVYFSEINTLSQSGASTLQKTSENEIINWLSVLFIIYITGMIFCLARFFLSYLQASAIQKASHQYIVDNQTVYLSEKNIRAFTFIDKIIIGKNILNHPSLKMVIDHEKVHLREKHFIDLFTIEFLSVFQWFNPFARILNKAIRLNLEYRADDMVVQHSNRRQYQMALISMVSDRIALPQFTELNSNNLRNRILMMKSPNESKFSKIRKLAVLPVFLILLAGLSEKTTALKTGNVPEMNLNIAESKLPKVQEKSTDTEITSIEELNKFISKSIKYPKEARKFGQFGMVSLFVKVNTNGKVTGVYKDQPEGRVFFYKDILLIIGYGNHPGQISDNHPSLYAECERVIEDFPILNIEEFKGRSLKMEFEFKLKK